MDSTWGNNGRKGTVIYGYISSKSSVRYEDFKFKYGQFKNQMG